jgi:iron(III) transport system ATP-binding protein
LYQAPANAFVADFIGDANIVDAQILSVKNAIASVRIGTAQLKLPARGLETGPARVAIRPESLLLTRFKPSISKSSTASLKTTGTKALAGKVTSCAFLGNHMDVTIETDIGELFLVLPGEQTDIATGTAVSLGFADVGVTLIPAS